MSIEPRPQSNHPLKKQLEELEMHLRWSRESIEATMYEPFTEVMPFDRCLHHIQEAEQAMRLAKEWHVVKKALGIYESKCDEA